MSKFNIAVFASGRGSNFKALVKAILRGTIPSAKIVLCISNNADAGALDIAKANGIEALHLSRKQFDTDATFETKLIDELAKRSVNLVLLAGYMKPVPKSLIEKFPNRILNIHPALLPKHGGKGMYGSHVHEAVLAAKETVTGATVHFVTEKYDEGEIILQRKVDVLPTDTVETLGERVLHVEHDLYADAVAEVITKIEMGKL
jgi:phosphoribosylglycinamide formyltransferase-1